MVDISAKTWNKDEFAALNIHENDNVNKTVLLLLRTTDASKKMCWWNISELIDKEIKGKYGVRKMSELTKPEIRKKQNRQSKIV